MIKVTADRGLRENIKHAHTNIAMDLERKHRIPSHFTFSSLPCEKMSLTMIHRRITLGYGAHSLRCGIRC